MRNKNFCALYIRDSAATIWKIVAKTNDVRLCSKNIRIKESNDIFVNEILNYYKAKHVDKIYPVDHGACLIDKKDKFLISMYCDYRSEFELNCSLEKVKTSWNYVQNNGWCSGYEDLMLKMSKNGIFNTQEEYQMLEGLHLKQLNLSEEFNVYPTSEHELTEWLQALQEQQNKKDLMIARLRFNFLPSGWEYKSLNIKEQWLGIEALFLDNELPWESNQTLKWTEEVLEGYMNRMSGIVDSGQIKRRIDFMEYLRGKIEAQKQSVILREAIGDSDDDKSKERGKGHKGHL